MQFAEEVTVSPAGKNKHEGILLLVSDCSQVFLPDP